MKPHRSFLIALPIVGGVALRVFAAGELPKPAEFSRYQPMLDHSPFAIATAATPPPVAPNFAKDLYVANAAHSADGDLVTIASSADKNFKEYLTTKESIHGYGISNIEWSDRVGATKVTISKDGQFAPLTFNQALLSQPMANTPGLPAQPSLPQPAIPQSNPAMQQGTPAAGFAPPRPMPIPSLPTPLPRVRSVIPRSPSAVGTPHRPLAGEPPS